MPSAAEKVTLSARERIIIALDVETVHEARELVAQLEDHVGAFKIGMQLFTAGGGELVREISSAGHRVFLDLKYHDIPNTVAKAAVEAARLGVWMFNVHALGGSEMMSRTADELAGFCSREGIAKPLLIAVTVLTSSDGSTLAEIGIDGGVEAEVLRLAKLAAGSGLDGIVASAREARMVRSESGSGDLLIVTPGVRPLFATNDDQKRVMTPAAAIEAGADHLVIGRAVTAAADPVDAMTRILEEIGEPQKRN